MRPFRMPPPFQHVFLLRPYESIQSAKSAGSTSNGRSWAPCAVLIDEHQATPAAPPRHAPTAPCCTIRATTTCRRRTWRNGLWPLTCVTFVRQVLGLPFRYRTWTPQALWDELVDGGARLLSHPGDRRG